MFNNSVDTIIEQEKAILSTMTIVERAQRIAMFKAIYGIDLREGTHYKTSSEGKIKTLHMGNL